MDASDNRSYRFPPFTADVARRKLWCDGEPVSIADKTFDTLLALIEHRDRVVSRDELLSLVWPDKVVEENNLDRHISTLRDVFGDKGQHKHRHIRTVPREGYRFVAELDDQAKSAEPAPQPEIREVAETAVATRSQMRWRLWLGLGLGTAGVVVALFVWARLARKPEILAIIPATPLATIGDQSIVVQGRNFDQETTVKVTFPSGGSGVLGRAQIQPRTDSSFVILVDFNNYDGKYTLEAINPWGRHSAPFTFKALPHIQSPIIEAIVPASPEAVKGEQRVVVYGHNFQKYVVIQVTFPNGESAILQGGQIPERMPVALTMLIHFGRSGAYEIRARNADGEWSAPFSFTVR